MKNQPTQKFISRFLTSSKTPSKDSSIRKTSSRILWKGVTFITIIAVLFMSLIVYPNRSLAVFEWAFGFQIKEVVNCECLFIPWFNHRYKPARWGLPAPLPPIPMNRGERYIGGSLATVPFGIPIPFYPQDEYGYKPLNEKEWQIGITHSIPYMLVPCSQTRITWKGPRCRVEFGWLWRRMGSAEKPDLLTPIW